MKHPSWVLFGFLGFAFALPQGQEQQPSGGHQHTHGEDNVEFLETSPRVGDRIPDVSGYDEQGEPVSLADFKGNYTVLICGCLT